MTTLRRPFETTLALLLPLCAFAQPSSISIREGEYEMRVSTSPPTKGKDGYMVQTGRMSKNCLKGDDAKRGIGIDKDCKLSTHEAHGTSVNWVTTCPASTISGKIKLHSAEEYDLVVKTSAKGEKPSTLYIASRRVADC